MRPRAYLMQNKASIK
uniref:Uncharacterized protein n=1 Tax=Rhizophora mucronata TaxID=61149 RepID=A0A2P2NT36_RHIMU